MNIKIHVESGGKVEMTDKPIKAFLVYLNDTMKAKHITTTSGAALR